MIEIAILLSYFITSFISYGLLLGEFTHEFPDQNQTRVGLIGLLPLSIVAVLLIHFFTGRQFHWRLKPLTYNERLAIFLKKYSPYLDEEYFKQHD